MIYKYKLKTIEDLSRGFATNIGEGGEMAIEVNFYDHLKECLTKEIKSLLKSAELVLAVP